MDNCLIHFIPARIETLSVRLVYERRAVGRDIPKPYGVDRIQHQGRLRWIFEASDHSTVALYTKSMRTEQMSLGMLCPRGKWACLCTWRKQTGYHVICYCLGPDSSIGCRPTQSGGGPYNTVFYGNSRSPIHWKARTRRIVRGQEGYKSDNTGPHVHHHYCLFLNSFGIPE